MRDYSVLDDLDEGVQIISSDMRYVYLNRRLLGEVGMVLEDLVGRRMTEIFPGIDNTEIYRKIRHCHQSGESSKVINEFTFADGRVAYYELRLQTIDEGVLVFSRDITTTRKGEILLRETNKNLDHFAHIAAHDMREPVRRIQILSEELLLDFAHDLPRQAEEICQKLNTQARSLMALINDFRTLSGIGSSEALKRENLSALELLAAAGRSYSAQFAEKSMTFNLPKEDLTVAVYPTLVGILINNLLANALKHGYGELNVEFDRAETPPVLVFSNPTSGKPLENDPFLPFVSGDRKDNTGLGLAIAKRVIDYHQGEIWAAQSGSSFEIRFTLQAR